MIKLLEEDSKETAHMNSEASWRIEEYKKKLDERSEELEKLTVELHGVKKYSYIFLMKICVNIPIKKKKVDKIFEIRTLPLIISTY